MNDAKTASEALTEVAVKLMLDSPEFRRLLVEAMEEMEREERLGLPAANDS